MIRQKHLYTMFASNCKTAGEILTPKRLWQISPTQLVWTAIFHEYKPQYIFHAAAYKHVPMMEDNVSESIQVNVAGTRILADLAVKYGADKFVMISTR